MITDRDWIEKLIEQAIFRIRPDIKDVDLNQEKITEIVDKTLPAIIDLIEADILSKSKKILNREQRTRTAFKKGLNKKWQSAFQLLELFIGFNREYAEVVSYYYREKNSSDIKFETLLRLQARACQIADEIYTLICNGFADGALARWRSLYEIAVLAEFLSDKPTELFQKYLDYYFVENYYEAIEYQKNCTMLSYEPLPEKEFEEIVQCKDKQQDKYGANFLKPYGWASDYLPKGKCNFSGMEEMCSFNEYKSFYKLANNYVHCGAKGFMFKLGLRDSEEVLLAGPSDYGFADPAQYTALFLHIISSTLSDFDPYLEDVVYSSIRERMVKQISDEFVNIQNEFEKIDS